MTATDDLISAIEPIYSLIGQGPNVHTGRHLSDCLALRNATATTIAITTSLRRQQQQELQQQQRLHRLKF